MARGRMCAGLLASVAMAGCGDRPPAGQVVATVAGTDITRRDLAIEASLNGRPPPSEAEMRGALLDELVARQLLVQRARRDGLDRSPEYLGAMRRDREVLLADIAARRIAEAAPRPSAQEVRDLVQSHPTMFAERTLFLVEEGDDGAPARRWIDGAGLPAAEAERLASARVGDSVTVPSVAGSAPLKLVQSRRAPLAGTVAGERALAMLQQTRTQERIARAVESERGSTRIRYQRGFGPAADERLN